jgi:hypothetical protein
MLSQAVYWNKRTGVHNGWFWKTQDEWTDETGLSRREQETARKTLKSLGIIEEKKEGIPARLYFRVNVVVLNAILAKYCEETPSKAIKIKDGGNRHTVESENAIQEGLKTPYSDGGNRLYNTEITSETTSETTSKRKDKAAAKEKFIVPDSINKIAFDEFEQHRKEIKKPLTDLAKTKACNQLQEFSSEDQQKIIDNSIRGGYPGLYVDCINRLSGQLKSKQQPQPRKAPQYIPPEQRNGTGLIIDSTASKL